MITIVCLLSAFALWLYIRNDERNATPSPVTDLGDELSTEARFICSESEWSRMAAQVRANRGKVRWIGYALGLLGFSLSFVLAVGMPDRPPWETLLGVFGLLLVVPFTVLASTGGAWIADVRLNRSATEPVVRAAQDMNIKLGIASAAALLVRDVVVANNFSFAAVHREDGVWLE